MTMSSQQAGFVLFLLMLELFGFYFEQAHVINPNCFRSPVTVTVSPVEGNQINAVVNQSC